MLPRVMKQVGSFLAGIAAALIFWGFILRDMRKEGMAGHESNHAFFPAFFLSCLIFLICYAGVSWLLAKDRRVSRENLLRAAVSFVAGLMATVVFWYVAAALIISLRRPGGPSPTGLFPLLFLGLVTFLLADRFVYRLLERRNAARLLRH